MIVPVLVIAAALLVGLQPFLVRRSAGTPLAHPAALSVSVGAASVYGGYFSAAQGVILLGVLGLFHPGTLNAQNGLKNVLQAVVNAVAACFFLVTASVNLPCALAVAAGSLVGAPLGAWLARRTPPVVFRSCVAVFGCVVGVVLFVRG